MAISEESDEEEADTIKIQKIKLRNFKESHIRVPPDNNKQVQTVPQNGAEQGLSLMTDQQLNRILRCGTTYSNLRHAFLALQLQNPQPLLH